MSSLASPASDRRRLPRSIPLTIAAALLGAALIGIALVDVDLIDPRITVRWNEDISAPHREMLERRYELGNPTREEGTTWRYQLGDRSRDNIGALVRDPAVDDTGYIDREALTAGSPRLRISFRNWPFPFGADEQFRNQWGVFQLQSLWLVLGGGIVLWASRTPSDRRRRRVAIVAALLVSAHYAFWRICLDPRFVNPGSL